MLPTRQSSVTRSPRSPPDLLPQHLDARRHGNVRSFLTLRLQGHIAGVIRVGEDFGDPWVIQFERIPFSAAIVGLGLYENGLGRDLLKFGIGVFQEIAGVHQHAQPRRVNGVDDAEQTFRGAGQAPIVFQREDDTAFRSLRQTPLNSLDTPLETLLFGVTVEDRFDTAIGHQGVEINRVPAAGVDANAWNAKMIRDLNASLGTLDGFA